MRKRKPLIAAALVALMLSFLAVQSFASAALRGDMNSDGAVDDKDIEYLLLYSVLGDLFPDAYPMYQSTDLNGDGNFNEKDIESLLMYVAFPEFFPLAPDTESECDHIWVDANCTTPKTCEKCLETDGDPIGHIPNADDGDCTTEITCSVCGEVMKEANASHTGGTATCARRAKCEVCGTEYGDLEEHTGETVWIKHVETHYFVYTCCYTQATDAEEHIKEDGVCTICGFNPIVTVSSVEITQDEKQVEIVVSISDNPGITGMVATVQYDSSALILTEAKNGEVLNGLTFTKPSNLNSGCKLLWDGVETKDEDIKDGEFLILTFDVIEEAPEGEYVISLNISSYDNDLNSIPLTITDGKVTIIKN